MQIKRPLLILAGGFVLGEVLGLRNNVAIGVAVAAMLTAAIGTAVFVLKKQEWMKAGRSLWMWLLPAFFCIGLWRAFTVNERCERELALGLDGSQISVTGTVLSRKIREDGSLVMVLGDCVGDGVELQRLQVYLDKGHHSDDSRKEKDGCKIGRKLLVSGDVLCFDSARNPGEFDYNLYARSQKLNYRMFADTCKEINDECRYLRDQLASFSEWAGGILEQIAEPKEYGVYRAAILGDSSRMDEELYALYREQGVAHLLAVSGLHLSLLSTAVYGSLRKLGFGYGIAGAAGSVVLLMYAMLTGESASVLRALIMGIVGFCAAYFGRTYDLMSAWSLALILLLWDSPYRLLQAGVQLSFGALAGIGWLAPVVLAHMRKEQEQGVDTSLPGQFLTGGMQIFVVSISMQVITLPILLYHYFQYPTYGILLNFLMVPLMGGVVASGTAGILCGGIYLALGHFALGGGHMILTWYEFCCRTAKRLPGSVLITGRPEWWKIGVYYGVLFVMVCRMKWAWKYRKRQNHVVFMGLLIGLLTIRVPSPNMTVTFLDVGQGDGVFLKSGMKTVLVDGGSTDQKELGKYTIVPFLHSQGISKLDYVIISHGDADHISGLQYLLDTGAVQIMYLIMPSAGRGQAVYETLAEDARRQGSAVYWMACGDAIRIRSLWWGKELRVTCISPESPRKTLDRNEHSLVLRVDYGDFHMLLTGDMSEDNEEEIMSQVPDQILTDIQVLKVAHHGSNTSTSEDWLQAIKPRWAVISYGEGNRYGHPDEAVLERLQKYCQVYETAKSGAIGLETNGKTIDWNVFLHADSEKE